MADDILHNFFTNKMPLMRAFNWCVQHASSNCIGIGISETPFLCDAHHQYCFVQTYFMCIDECNFNLQMEELEKIFLSMYGSIEMLSRKKSLQIQLQLISPDFRLIRIAWLILCILDEKSSWHGVKINRSIKPEPHEVSLLRQKQRGVSITKHHSTS